MKQLKFLLLALVAFMATNAWATTYEATYLTYSQINAMENGTSKTVLIANPHKNNGYFLGYDGSSKVSTLFGSTMAAGLSTAQTLANNANYRLTLTKTDDGKYTIESTGHTGYYLTNSPGWGSSYSWQIITVSSLTSTSDMAEDYVQGDLFRLYTGSNWLNSQGNISNWLMNGGTGEWTVWCAYEVTEAQGTFYTITYNYQINGVTYETEEFSVLDGANYPIPTASKFPDYVTCSAPSGTVTQDETKNLEVTVTDYPFTLSSSYNDATWYYIKMRGNVYAYSNTGGGTNQAPYASSNGETDYYKWAFVGTPFGYKIYNKAVGSGSALTYNKSTDESMKFEEESSDFVTVYSNKSYDSSDTQKNDGSGERNVYIKVKGTANFFINKRTGMQFWNSSAANGEVGSALAIIEVPDAKHQLEDLLTEANTFNTEFGTHLDDFGYLTTAAHTSLSSAITAAQSVYDASESTDDDYTNQYNTLSTTLSTVKSAGIAKPTAGSLLRFLGVSEKYALGTTGSNDAIPMGDVDGTNNVWYYSTDNYLFGYNNERHVGMTRFFDDGSSNWNTFTFPATDVAGKLAVRSNYNNGGQYWYDDYTKNTYVNRNGSVDANCKWTVAAVPASEYYSIVFVMSDETEVPANAGIVYGERTFTSVLPYIVAATITDSEVEAASDVTGYDGSVSINTETRTITVTYEPSATPVEYTVVVSPAELASLGGVVYNETQVHGSGTFEHTGALTESNYTIIPVDKYPYTSASLVDQTLTVTYDQYKICFSKDQKYTRTDRHIGGVKLTEDGKSEQSLTVPFNTSTTTNCYQFLTGDDASKKFTVTAGSTVTPAFSWTGNAMRGFVYLDFDNDGSFEGASEYTSVTGDYVSTSLDNGTTAQEHHLNNKSTLPSFIAPSTPGTYRMRYKVDWNSTDPAGQDNSGSNYIIDNGGSITDVLLVVIPTTTTATITSTGYATFSSDYALDFTDVEDLKVYKAAVDNDNGVIKFTKITGEVPANTGLFLAGNASKSYIIPTISVTSATVDDNDLAPTTGEALAAGDYVYVISAARFQRLQNTPTVSKGKAYIPASKVTWTSGGTAKELGFSFDDDPTGISEVAGSKEQVAGGIFNLAGQKIASPVKGQVYIVNGKKVMY